MALGGSREGLSQVPKPGRGRAPRPRQWSSLFFADDTTIVGRRGELGKGVEAVKEVMGKWEEKNNEDKEERLEFGTAEVREIRLLGNWLGSKQDIRNRIKRAGGV